MSQTAQHLCTVSTSLKMVRSQKNPSVKIISGNLRSTGAFAISRLVQNVSRGQIGCKVAHTTADWASQHFCKTNIARQGNPFILVLKIFVCEFPKVFSKDLKLTWHNTRMKCSLGEPDDTFTLIDLFKSYKFSIKSYQLMMFTSVNLMK